MVSKNNALSLRFLVAMVVLIPVLAIAVLLLWIGNSTARRLSDQLGDRMLQGATRSVGAQVKGYLADAMRTGDLFARRVEQGSLSVDQLDAWPMPILDVLTTNADIAAITLGKPNDDSAYVQRVAGQLEVCEAYGNETIDNQYVIDENGKQSDTPNRTYDYRPTSRPWYQIAIKDQSPRWTPVYTWFAQSNTDATMGTAYVVKTHDSARNFNGVLCIDVTLDGLSAFLKSIVPNQSSLLFLIDNEQKLVAASRGQMTRNGDRTTLGGSDDPVASAIGHALNVGGQADPTAKPDHRLNINGEFYRVRIENIAPYPGIEWQVIAALPERELFAEARDTQKRSILLALIVAAGGIVLAIFQARRISLPIVAIEKHADKIAEGDFDSEIKVQGARELISLSENLNKMSHDLKNRVELMQSLKLATQVQQSLLPRANPTLANLDIHGVSRYCDQTGGDYFDFIELGESPTGELLIAVGDVMGHGIGSAMLMSSARGAL
ncbi:MAG TPA: cache domain-containing protein, partial [Tepidisphaeraceae bacterium]|nr:cache domain-containing protein [Tepidisphaeraceae bacterium]